MVPNLTNESYVRMRLPTEFLYLEVEQNRHELLLYTWRVLCSDSSGGVEVCSYQIQKSVLISL